MAFSELTIERRGALVMIAAFAVIALLAAVDLATDLTVGAPPRHVAVEGLVIILSLLGGLAVGRRLIVTTREARRAQAEAESLARSLEATEQEARQWREEAQEHIRGLAVAIDLQFSRWKLTTAEKEVGLLLLKGLGHKEIAAIRGVSEPTTRQQARALYKKAGLSGRNDLAAFFLEDLMLPHDQ